MTNLEFIVKPFPVDHHAHELVRDLQAPCPATYWTDFVITSITGWSAFALAVHYPLFSPPMALAAVIATFSLYRGLLFVHEISHFTRGGMRGFKTAWNLLSGYPLLLPSFVYCGVHQDHHRISLYGTERDPEYLTFAQSRGMTLCFTLESFLIPILLAIRFLIAAPLGLLCPPLHRCLAVHASSLVINFKYKRDLSGGLEQQMRRGEIAVLLVWGTAAVLVEQRVLPWRIFAVWLIVVSIISFLNALRTLDAHHYESVGEPMDRAGQLLDSIDHPGARGPDCGRRSDFATTRSILLPRHSVSQPGDRLSPAGAEPATHCRVSSQHQSQSGSLSAHAVGTQKFIETFSDLASRQSRRAFPLAAFCVRVRFSRVNSCLRMRI